MYLQTARRHGLFPMKHEHHLHEIRSHDKPITVYIIHLVNEFHDLVGPEHTESGYGHKPFCKVHGTVVPEEEGERTEGEDEGEDEGEN